MDVSRFESGKLLHAAVFRKHVPRGMCLEPQGEAEAGLKADVRKFTPARALISSVSIAGGQGQWAGVRSAADGQPPLTYLRSVCTAPRTWLSAGPAAAGDSISLEEVAALFESAERTQGYFNLFLISVCFKIQINAGMINMKAIFLH